MTIIKCDDHVKQPRTIWFLILGCLWILWIINLAQDAYAFASAQDIQNAGRGIWSADPRDVRTWIHIRGVVALVIVFVIAHFLALAQVAIVRGAKEKLRQRRSQPAQRIPQMQHSFAVTIKKKKKQKTKTNTP